MGDRGGGTNRPGAVISITTAAAAPVLVSLLMFLEPASLAVVLPNLSFLEQTSFLPSLELVSRQKPLNHHCPLDHQIYPVAAAAPTLGARG